MDTFPADTMDMEIDLDLNVEDEQPLQVVRLSELKYSITCTN